MEFGGGGTGPSERNQTISSRFGEFGDRRFREPSPENRDNPPIPTDSAPVRSRSTTAKHQRRPELSPASIPAVVAASKGENRRPPASSPPLPHPGRPSANGPRPISLSLQARPNVLQSGPASLPGGRSDPIRSDPIVQRFFFYREVHQLSELGKFST
ncbi:hypothetical protein CRG98_020293 [Punica granatum]|uniref:Uncharacterized protein n=1 Tax=Punica granatum TaxID=22663 RepID=A0A2I0JSR6_PUNGR|nr:hypothetical protein CRG98_020293 [Punica granatum]